VKYWVGNPPSDWSKVWPLSGSELRFFLKEASSKWRIASVFPLEQLPTTLGNACGYLADESLPLNMSRVYAECPDSANVLLRHEPDEEEDEEEDGGNDKEGDGDDEETNDGYSE
jgi:hypothetical protein